MEGIVIVILEGAHLIENLLDFWTYESVKVKSLRNDKGEVEQD